MWLEKKRHGVTGQVFDAVRIGGMSANESSPVAAPPPGASLPGRVSPEPPVMDATKFFSRRGPEDPDAPVVGSPLAKKFSKLVAEDEALEPMRHIPWTGEALKALPAAKKVEVARGHHPPPITLLRYLLVRFDNPGIITEVFDLEKQRVAVLRPYLAHMLVHASARFRGKHHIIGSELQALWMGLRPEAREVFPAHLEDVIPALAKISPNGEITMDCNAPEVAHALLRSDSLTVRWLLENRHG